MDPTAVGAAPAPAPVAAAEAQEAAFRLAAMHSRLAYIRGGPSPQRTLRWDPRFVYPPVVAAQNPAVAPLLNLLYAQAQAVGGSPAGLHQGGGRGRGAGGGRGRGGVAQNAFTPAAAQQAFLAALQGQQPDARDPEDAFVALRFHRAELTLDPQSDLGYVRNASALRRNMCRLPSPRV